MSNRHVPVLIIGSGPAGYTAAIYAARAMLKPVLIAGMEQGGQLMITTDVENYPGYADPVQGPWMMEQMLKQAEHVGADDRQRPRHRSRSPTRPFHGDGDSGAVWTCDALIIATGAQAKWLGIPTEKEFMGFGVSACATCDGFFYRGKNVIVVGGGNSAVEEALYLSNLASTVTVVHRRDVPRRKDPAAAAFRQGQHRRHLGHRSDRRYLGAKNKPPMPAAVTGVKLKNRKTGESTDMPIDGVFVAIGHAPAVSPVQGQAQAQAERLSVDSAGFDCHRCARACLLPAT
jgi:thioredoxin reductase (NADPH)